MLYAKDGCKASRPSSASFTLLIWSIFRTLVDLWPDGANGAVPAETAGAALSTAADMQPTKEAKKKKLQCFQWPHRSRPSSMKAVTFETDVTIYIHKGSINGPLGWYGLPQNGWTCLFSAQNLALRFFSTRLLADLFCILEGVNF